MIQAQSADGVIHQFPDNTPDDAVDAAMRDYASKAAPAEADDTPGVALQNANTGEVLSRYPAHAPAPPPAPSKPDDLGSTLGDMAGGAISGAEQGVGTVLGLPGDARELGLKGVGAVADFLGPKLGADPATINKYKTGVADFARNNLPMGLGAAPTSQQLNDLRQRFTGPDYVPQTTAGQFARTLGQFLPAALSPGTMAARVGAVAIPGVASETAGQVTKGTPFEGAARFVAGLGAGALTPSLVSRAASIPQRMSAAADAAPDLRVANVIGDAAYGDQIHPTTLAARAVAQPTRPAYLAGGDNMHSLADLVAQMPGPGKAIVRNALTADQGQIADEIEKALGWSMGAKGNFFSTMDAAQAARSAEAKAEMARIGDHLVTLSPDSVQAIRSDLSNGALKSAADNALASVDPAVRDTGAALNRLNAQALDKPSAITLPIRHAQDISRALLDGADNAFKTGNGSRGVALKGLGKAIRDNARTPELGGHGDYDAWLKKYGDDSTNIEALQLGKRVLNKDAVSGETSAERIGQQHAEWSDAAKEAYRKGVGEALLYEARWGNGAAAIRKMLNSREISARLRMAFPSQTAFDKFKDQVRILEQQQAKNAGVIGVGSRTQPRQALAEKLGEQPGMHPADAAGHVLETVVHPASAVGKGAKALLKSIPRKDRSVLGDPELNAGLAKALTDPKEMDRIIKLLTRHHARTPPIRPSLSGAVVGGLLAR